MVNPWISTRLDGQYWKVKFINPKLEINKTKIPKIANDLLEKILLRMLYIIKDAIGIVKNKKIFGIRMKSMPEKKWKTAPIMWKPIAPKYSLRGKEFADVIILIIRIWYHGSVPPKISTFANNAIINKNIKMINNNPISILYITKP